MYFWSPSVYWEQHCYMSLTVYCFCLVGQWAGDWHRHFTSVFWNSCSLPAPFIPLKELNASTLAQPGKHLQTSRGPLWMKRPFYFYYLSYLSKRKPRDIVFIGCGWQLPGRVVERLPWKAPSNVCKQGRGQCSPTINPIFEDSLVMSACWYCS